MAKSNLKKSGSVIKKPSVMEEMAKKAPKAKKAAAEPTEQEKMEELEKRGQQRLFPKDEPKQEEKIEAAAADNEQKKRGRKKSDEPRTPITLSVPKTIYDKLSLLSKIKETPKSAIIYQLISEEYDKNKEIVEAYLKYKEAVKK